MANHNKIMAATIAKTMDFARIEVYQYDADVMLGRKE